MTDAPSILAKLLVDCEAQRIRLAPAGDCGLTIDAPQDALTPDLLDRLKAHRAELLAILGHKADTPGINPPQASAFWQRELDRLNGNPLFPPDVLEALRAAEVGRADGELSCDPATETAPEPLRPDGWPADSIDPDSLTPCPDCGTLEQWQSAIGDLLVLTPGRWRCMKCDPPTTARRPAELAERIRSNES